MELNEEDGHWRATVDLADGKILFIFTLLLYLFIYYQGIYHYQYKVVTKSWFEEEPEPALPDYTDDETKSRVFFYLFMKLLNDLCFSSNGRK